MSATELAVGLEIFSMAEIFSSLKATRLAKLITNLLSQNERKVLSYHQIPGPRSYPMIGNVLGYQSPSTGRCHRSHERRRLMTMMMMITVSRNPSQTLKIWAHLHREHGPLVRLDIPGREPTVLVFDPHVAEQVNCFNLVSSNDFKYLQKF